MCFVVFKLATDHPKDADWLTDEQRAWLVDRLACERAQREAVHTYSLGETFANPKMWLLTVTYFSQNVTGYGLVFFLPLIVKGLSVSTDWIGLVSALPLPVRLRGDDRQGLPLRPHGRSHLAC
jgi:ACS family tartrate transporter-like MFS transporter